MTLRAYNGTNGEDGDLTDDSRSPGLVIFEVSFLVAIIAVSVSGNLLVLACLVVDRKLRTVSNMFVANLAVADVYITGLLMPFVVTSVIVNEWIFGEPYCKIHGFIQTILYTGSFYTHAVIAVNRFCLIAYPSRYSTVFSRRNSIVILTVLWASCAAYAMPQVIAGRGVDVIYIAEIYNCLFDGSSNLTYLYVTAVLAYGLPTVVIIASYAGIYHTVRASRKRVAASQAVRLRKYTGNRSSLSGNSEDSREAAEQRSHNVRLTRHLCLVTLAFFLCWAPYCIVAMVDAFDDSYIPDAAHTATNWLALSNSAFNPILYGWMNRQFRNAYRRVVCRPSCCWSSRSVEDAVAAQRRRAPSQPNVPPVTGQSSLSE